MRSLQSAFYNRRSEAKAFTIVELLVAVGVTAILVTIMLTVTINVLNTWNRTSGSLSAGNQARLILEQITTDMDGAIIQRDDNVWLAVTLLNNQSGNGDTNMENEDWNNGQVKPTAPISGNGTDAKATLGSNDSLVITSSDEGKRLIENYRFGQAGVWLRFFTTPSDENDSTKIETTSTPRAVSYRLVRRNLSGQYSYQLFRSEVLPVSVSREDISITPPTQHTVHGTFNEGFDIVKSSSNYNTSNDELGDAGNLLTPNEAQLIGNNIVDFGIRLYETNNSGGSPIEVFPMDRRPVSHVIADVFVATTSTTKDQPTNPANNSRLRSNTARGFPVVAEVMIRVLTDEGVRLLQAYEEGHLTLPTDENWWTLVEKHSHVYTRRIALKSTPL